MRNCRVASISYRHTGGGVADHLSAAMVRVDEAGLYKPDIVVLPEACANDIGTAEPVLGSITQAFAQRARSIGCYMIVPLYRSVADGSVSNVAVLLDPRGQVVGEYSKMFPTDSELASGVRPGTDTPVFDTPFGKLGIAICFDLNFSEVIEGLAAAGAEVVFFVSMYEGGRQLERWALDHSVYVVSCHWGGLGHIVDKTGRELQTSDGGYGPIMVRDLNLDRQVLHLDYAWTRIPKVIAKYGRSLHVDVCRPEAIFALESRSADVSVQDVLREFGFETFRDYMARARRCREAALRDELVQVGPPPRAAS